MPGNCSMNSPASCHYSQYDHSNKHFSHVQKKIMEFLLGSTDACRSILVIMPAQGNWFWEFLIPVPLLLQLKNFSAFPSHSLLVPTSKGRWMKERNKIQILPFLNILIHFQFYNFNCSIPFWYLESCTHSFFVLTANVCVYCFFSSS